MSSLRPSFSKWGAKSRSQRKQGKVLAPEEHWVGTSLIESQAMSATHLGDWTEPETAS